MVIRIKRVYEPATKVDGYRVLVDRLWPRGVSKAEAGIDLWLPSIAPSSRLRTWFQHDPMKWGEFEKRYHAELRMQEDALTPLIERARKGPVTLVYSARNERHNQAVALQAYLQRRRRSRKASTGGSRAYRSRRS